MQLNRFQYYKANNATGKEREEHFFDIVCI